MLLATLPSLLHQAFLRRPFFFPDKDYELYGTVKRLWLVSRWIVSHPNITETVDWVLKSNYLQVQHSTAAMTKSGKNPHEISETKKIKRDPLHTWEILDALRPVNSGWLYQGETKRIPTTSKNVIHYLIRIPPLRIGQIWGKMKLNEQWRQKLAT